ncbi:hypothetical protein H6F87_29050 [Cyanobacteria bacterium FACHB-502]|nr:hypothetical protein [Cyanobacteria bacterium FACHB-502]
MKIRLSRRAIVVLVLLQVAVDIGLIINAWVSARFSSQITNLLLGQ